MINEQNFHLFEMEFFPNSKTQNLNIHTVVSKGYEWPNSDGNFDVGRHCTICLLRVLKPTKVKRTDFVYTVIL